MAASEQELRDQLVGEWQLVNMLMTLPDGSTTYFRGEHAIGQLAYTASGRVICTVMDEQRITAFADPAAPTQAEEAEAYRTSTAYWGTYEIDAENQIVTHLPVGATNPHEVGVALPRKFRFEDDKLIIHKAPTGLMLTTWRRSS